MAQRTDNPGDTSFLVKNQPTNQWLVNKSDINPSYSVLEEYYARQRAAKAAQQRVQAQPKPQQPQASFPKYSATQPAPYDPTKGFIQPVGPTQTQAKLPTAPTWQQAQTRQWNAGQVSSPLQNTILDFSNWYRGTMGFNAPQMAPANIQQASKTTGMGELQRVNGPYEYNPTGAYSNQVYGPPAYLKTQTVRPYRIAATTARMQEAEATGYGQLPLPHLPAPPTTTSGGGVSSAGYYDPYAGYGGGGGGWGNYNYDTSQKWWTNTAVWRI